MDDILEAGRINNLRDEVEANAEALVRGQKTRAEIDAWVQGLENRYDIEILDKLKFYDQPLSDLIDALGLAITPGNDSTWLYDEIDFKRWLDEYYHDRKGIDG